jgi:hypothetical protein
LILDETTCPAHGFLSHLVTHEAAHAVFAVDLGIDFLDVTIEPPQHALMQLREPGDQTALGGVRMAVEDPAVWVLSRPHESLEFVLAGSWAELVYLNHCLDGGHQGDLEIWRRGMGWFDPVESADFSAYLEIVQPRAELRLADRRLAIQAVGQALLSQIPEQGGPVGTVSAPLVLSAAEVGEILAAMG